MRIFKFDYRLLSLMALVLALSFWSQRESAGQPSEDEARDQIESLQRQRVEILQRLVDAKQVRYEQGIGTQEELLRASNDLLHAELDLAQEPAERIAIRRRQLELFQHLEAMMEARVETATAAHTDLLVIQAERIQVEIDFIKEQTATE